MLARFVLAIALAFILTPNTKADYDPPCIPACELTESLISVPDINFFGPQPVTYSITDAQDTDFITLMLDLNQPEVFDPNRTIIRNGYTVAMADWQDAEGPAILWHEVVINGQDWLVDPPAIPTETPELPTFALLATGLLGLALAYLYVNPGSITSLVK